MKTRLLFLAAATSLGCAAPVAPVSHGASDLIQVSSTANQLTIKNASSDAVYYFALNQNTLASIDWRPCTNPDTCAPTIAGGATVNIPYDSITFGGETGQQVVVYNWRLVPSTTSGGFAVDSLRQTSVVLR